MPEPIGQRGKAAEKTVEKVLKKFNDLSGFSYFRLPDSHAARSFVSASPGDFAYFANGKGGIIEVKSTSHDFRIAKDKISQLPVLKKLDLAGAQSVVLIHFVKLDAWRFVLPRDLPTDVPSWNLLHLPSYATAEEALLATGYFEGIK